MKNKKALFIAFEGADGCGKSTISRMVAERLNAEWISTPSDKFKEIRKVADAEYQNCGLAAQLFYAATVVHTASLVKECMRRGKSVAIDRYAASTIVYDKIVRRSGLSDSFWINSIFGGIAVPDITFHLGIDDNIRASRMDKRGQRDATDETSINQAKELGARYARVLKILNTEKSWKIVRISNQRTPEICADKCITEIKKL